jgi:hypothetical protein
MSNLQGEVLGALLAVALLIYTFWPESALTGQREKSRLEFLLERRDQLAENLRDLNFEFSAGKYPQEDYEAQRTQIEAEAIQLQAEIELLQ